MVEKVLSTIERNLPSNLLERRILMKRPGKERLVVALDVESIETAEKLVEELKDYVGVFKVGSQLFTSLGPEIIRRIQQKGGRVFLDLKYHDIPHTI
jgi:orotidine-5'-phosphate decarboxylase